MMMRRKMMTTMVLVAGLSLPALAQQGPDTQQQQQRQKQQQKQQQKQSGQQMSAQQQQQARQDLSQKQVEGRLVGVRTIRLSGEQDPHVLGKVRMQNGKTAVIDLGPRQDLRRQGVRLQRNEQIRAAGQLGRIAGRPVLVADRFQSQDDGAVVTIFAIPAQQQRRQQSMQRRGQRFTQQGQQRFAQQGQRQAGRRGQMTRPVMVQGELVEARDVQIQGLSDEHRLAKLRTRSGQTVVVDLGTGRELRDVRLRGGEQVAVVGRMGRVNDRPVLFATHVADIVQIDRSREQQQSQQRQQQSRQQRQDRSQQRQNQQDQQQDQWNW